MRASRPEATAAAGAALKETRLLLLRHRRRLLLAFAGVLLPLWGFAELAGEIRDRETIAFDAPILGFARGLANAGLDRAFVWISNAGYSHFVVPFDIVLVAALVLLRRLREAMFAGLALGGAGLLNVAAKHAFARQRPVLWESIAPEATFSFPSAHAMGSAALVCVLLLLAWPTRWRWVAVVVGVPFVALVGFSRVYLGVHFPSDVLAGWAAASAWTAAVYLLVFRVHQRPWRSG